MVSANCLFRLIALVLTLPLLPMFCFASGPTAGYTFGPSSQIYNVDVTELDVWDAVSVSLWVRASENCRAGAVIFDKLGPATHQGLRLELSSDDTLRLLSSAPEVLQSSTKLSRGVWTFIVATLDPRSNTVSLYVNGELAASRPTNARERITIIGSQTSLQIGADQQGKHRLEGQIAEAALYNRGLQAADVSALFNGSVQAPGLVGAWELRPDSGRLITPQVGKVPMRPFESAAPAQGPTINDLTLWYEQPAREWLESVAFGNGRLGGTVFGGPTHERVQLNESTIWSGGPYDPANPQALEGIKAARKSLQDGRQKEAEDAIQKLAMGLPPTQASYQTLGSLMLDTPDDGTPVTGYRRSLDLTTAVATTVFTRNGVTYKREVFASAPDQAVVVRITADKPNSVTLNARFSTPFKDARTAAQGDLLMLSGHGGDSRVGRGLIQFNSLGKVLQEGGAVNATGDTVSVKAANAVTILIVCRTNYVNYHDLTANPEAASQHDLNAVVGKPFEQIRRDHVADHQRFFNRVKLDLGRTPSADLPTDQRVRQFDGSDAALAAMYFQFGRYLLISSSRPGGQPANLAGLWNDALTAAWGGKYTININTEENYWPAETTNLTEMAEPLFQMIRDISVTGQKTATVMYHANGWVAHHNTDIWRATAPIDSAVGFWPVGGAWLTTHMWQHYLFTGDRQFLASAYPIFKGASQFFVDTLVEEPNHHWLVTSPSMSPEHGGLTIGPTMDMSILRDLFAQTAEASEILNVDPELRQKVLATRARLAPFQIGKFGQLQEWLTDLDNMRDTHRHLSHLYGLFPSNQISPEADPKVYQAAKVSLIARGMIGTGWSLAWKENLWARMGDGNRAYRLLVTQLTPPKGGSQGGGTFPNLFDAHPPFQIDGNFAATSAIAEMLLQSQGGELRLLPALPDAWAAGSVRGLVARGGFVVAMDWEGHHLSMATVESRLGGECRIRSRGPLQVRTSDGQPVATTRARDGAFVFSTQKGASYSIRE